MCCITVIYKRIWKCFILINMKRNWYKLPKKKKIQNLLEVKNSHAFVGQQLVPQDIFIAHIWNSYQALLRETSLWIWLLTMKVFFSRKFLSKNKGLDCCNSLKTLPTWILPLHHPTCFRLWKASLHVRPCLLTQSLPISLLY